MNFIYKMFIDNCGLKVELMGGSISVLSKENGGFMFLFKLLFWVVEYLLSSFIFGGDFECMIE